MRNELVPVEHEGQRVITTDLLAEIYETDPDNIKHNFNRNKDHFKEGIHYFLLQGDVLRAFKREVTGSPFAVQPNVNQLYVWTERGASRHCKILDTPRAWERFDNLEETYFLVKEHRESMGEPKSAMEMLRVMSQATLELDDRVTDLEEKVDKQMTIDSGQQRQIQRAVAERVYERAAAVFPPKEVKANVGPLFKALYKALKNAFGIPSYRDIRPADYANALAYIGSWIEPAELRNKEEGHTDG